ncbi:MAG: cyclic nucleotide-binding domain-containing protein [Geminicoccaceae bacterium]|nr:cyclic nucleotide-binding domain-containing protein [Geminicoccaceae bacterium]
MLNALPLFQALGPEALRRLLKDSFARGYERGAILFFQGDVAERFYIVLDGWVRLVRHTPDGGEITLAVFTAGETLAEAAVLDLHQFPVEGQVVAPSRLLVIPADGFRAFLREDAALCFSIIAALSRRLLFFLQKIEQLSTRSTVERTAQFLLRFATQEEGSCTVRLPLDKSLIAARLGMQPETLSRAFAKLRPLGVRVEREVVVIDDVKALRSRFAEGNALALN